ncbi:hypothetical protein B0H13DRAFT_2305707 [Mycena leptocephala]|nr:hypothetical protein B0H13DRAFT_2305707 [Mycena leptocephala]
MGKNAVTILAPPFFIVSPDILIVRVPMARRAPGELEQLLNRLPHAVLFHFQDEALVPEKLQNEEPAILFWERLD